MKKAFYLVDFTVLADHGVKTQDTDEYPDFARDLKTVMDSEGNINCS